jgi:CRISPR system Cascade subunit CasC
MTGHTPLFVQIHALTSFSASLLNRDDAGFAKRITFGGATRTRISSQCLKRHWRTFEGEGALTEIGDLAVRSRITFEREVFRPLIASGVPEPLATAVVKALMEQVLGKSDKAKKADEAKQAEEAKPGEEAETGLRTGQVTVLGRAEVNYLLEVAKAVCGQRMGIKEVAQGVKEKLGREGQANLKALAKAAGLDAAMFGRFITGDVFARGDGAIHVAHAFTVHEEATESDYFSAVDDLLKETDEAGSGHIGSAELTTGLYYTHVVVDVPLLVANLEGCAQNAWLKADRALASEVVRRLVQLVARVSPGAKQGSTAPYSFASMVMVEAGQGQPCSLANAFLKPVNPRPDLLGNTYQALNRHLVQLDHMYPANIPKRQVLGMGGIELLASIPGLGSEEAGLPGIANWAAKQILGFQGEGKA